MPKKLLIALLLLIVALGMIGFGVYMKFFSQQGMADVKAVITKVEEEYDPAAGENGEWTHTATVEFTVDGQKYGGVLDTWEAGFEEGKEITIKYNPDNPADFHGDVTGMSIFLIIGGAVLAVVDVVLFLAGKF